MLIWSSFILLWLEEENISFSWSTHLMGTCWNLLRKMGQSKSYNVVCGFRKFFQVTYAFPNSYFCCYTKDTDKGGLHTSSQFLRSNRNSLPTWCWHCSPWPEMWEYITGPELSNQNSRFWFCPMDSWWSWKTHTIQYFLRVAVLCGTRSN